MKRAWSRMAAVTSIGLVAALLSSCITPLAELEAGLEGQDVLFRPCYETGIVDTIRVRIASGAQSERQLVWELTGEGVFEPGEVIRYGTAPPGFQESAEPIRFEPSEKVVYVTLLGFDGGVRFSDTLRVDGDDLVEGMWLSAGGALSSGDCSNDAG